MKTYKFDTEKEFIPECFGMTKDNHNAFTQDLTRFMIGSSIMGKGNNTKVKSLEQFLNETDLTKYSFPQEYQEILVGIEFNMAIRLTNEFFRDMIPRGLTTGSEILKTENEKEEKLSN